MALIFVTWIWGTKYGSHYLKRLRKGVHKHCKGPHIFKVIEPPPTDESLFVGCLCRLRMFSTDWQASNGIVEGDQIACLDLDLIVTGGLDQIFGRPEDFVILQGANSANPCPYNGSVMMLRAGKHPEVWDDFSLEAAKRIPYYKFPDDQSWLWHKLPQAAVWPVGPASGIYAFRKPQWPQGDTLPADARIVAFPGSRDPSHFLLLPWVQQHWLSA